ncbi:MAG: DNA-processing protein DprA [Rhodomicrobiaceae bacterium]
MAREKADGRSVVDGKVKPIRLDDAEKLDWIRLIRTETIGPITFHELIEHFGSARAALEAIPELVRRGGSRAARRICSLGDAEREFEAARKAGARILASAESDYPALLKHIPAQPPLIFAKGDTSLPARETVAVVGSRNASAVGRQFTADLVRELGAAALVIASGLARGIDTSAHHAALASGTIAAIAGGIDTIYPPENARLHEAIAESGLLISENPPGFAPRGQDFPRRNRIISGVSSGVVVIEAARKSGSLITARLALEQGREVFAVPGHPLDPRASGTNGLIKGGAHLVTCADDILGELGSPFRSGHRWSESLVCTERHASRATETIDRPSEKDHERILAALSLTPIQPDMLLRQTGLSARSLTVALLELGLTGRIERHDDQSISLKPAAMRML